MFLNIMKRLTCRNLNTMETVSVLFLSPFSSLGDSQICRDPQGSPDLQRLTEILKIVRDSQRFPKSHRDP
jgi:hypothetical protein